MPTSGSPTVRRRRLAAELRRLRARTGKTAEDVGKALGWSKAKISRYELAQGGLKPAEVAKLLDYYEVHGSQREQLLALANDAADPARLIRDTSEQAAKMLAMLAADREPDKISGHAFISYVREDSAQVAQLQELLQSTGIPVWRDTADLWPGEDWRVKIRRAITDDALAFLACFSRNSVARSKSYQNEELVLAIEQLRQRRPEDPWLIPIRFDDCDIPDRDIGDCRTLQSIQRADLFGIHHDENATRLVDAIKRILASARRS